MEASKIINTIKKAVNIMMIVMVVSGTVALAVMSRSNLDGELLAKVFLVFFGIMITVQGIAGTIMSGMILKEPFWLYHKTVAKQAVRK